ncbi:MAG: hypothetical protein ACRDGI_09300, partial [Candidatus Limnocylindrales bacterium]
MTRAIAGGLTALLLAVALMFGGNVRPSLALDPAVCSAGAQTYVCNGIVTPAGGPVGTSLTFSAVYHNTSGATGGYVNLTVTRTAPLPVTTAINVQPMTAGAGTPNVGQVFSYSTTSLAAGTYS